MKRYIVFAGDTYYPSGGMRDYRGGFDTEEGALGYAKAVAEESLKWAHVFDTEARRVVWDSTERM